MKELVGVIDVVQQDSTAARSEIWRAIRMEIGTTQMRLQLLPGVAYALNKGQKLSRTTAC